MLSAGGFWPGGDVAGQPGSPEQRGRPTVRRQCDVVPAAAAGGKSWHRAPPAQRRSGDRQCRGGNAALCPGEAIWQRVPGGRWLLQGQRARPSVTRSRLAARATPLTCDCSASDGTIVRCRRCPLRVSPACALLRPSVGLDDLRRRLVVFACRSNVYSTGRRSRGLPRSRRPAPPVSQRVRSRRGDGWPGR